MKIFPLLLLSITLLSCVQTQNNTADIENLHFKNWALSRCLSEIASNTADKQDALNTASGYLENSSLPIEAFENADKLIKTFINKSYSGSIPGTFNTKKCIDLFYSDELEQLYQSSSEQQ